MAGQKVEMDYQVITSVSKGFDVQHTVLDATGKLLNIAIQALRAAAFFSMGTTLALANYLEVIMNKVNKLSQVCVWFSKNLAQAVTDHQNGDVAGKHYFEGDLGLG
jgi:hypothetical protein